MPHRRPGPLASSPPPDRLNRARYTIYAPLYDAIASFLRPQRSAAIASLVLRPGERVLLVGCGTGLDLEFIPRGAHVNGLDITPGMVTRARQRAERLGIQGEFIVGDARDLPYADASFDVIVLHLILAVAPAPERIAREADRVLVPGGRASIFDKFLLAGESPGILRRAANVIARATFSDLNRRAEPILAATTWEIVANEAAGFRGMYRRILAQKPVPA